MPDIKNIFSEKLIVIDMGLESFNIDLKAQDVQSMQANWRPTSEASKKISLVEGDSISEKIDVANKEAIARLLAAEPIIVGIGTAGTHVPGMTKNTILHAGPSIDWEQMSESLKGAIVGGLIYEKLVTNEEEGRILASSGKIIFDSCHHHSTVGPMAGVVTSSMPVWIIQNRTFESFAYCTLNEGLGKVLMFGAFSPEVIDRLNWIENILAPVLKEALEIKGSIDLKSIIAQSLQMGDGGHNRNKVGTSLLFRELAPCIVRTQCTNDEKVEVLTFIDKNDNFFLNISMLACKCILDPLSDIQNSTGIVHPQ